MNQKQYIQYFWKITQERKDNNLTVNKVIYLLTLIDAISRGFLPTNKFLFLPIFDTLFNENWNKYIGSEEIFEPNINKAAYQCDEYDFYQLHTMIGNEKRAWKTREGFSDIYQYIEFDEDLYFHINNDSKFTASLRLILISALAKIFYDDWGIIDITQTNENSVITDNTQDENQSQKKYSLDGISYLSMSSFVLALVKKYLKDNPQTTFKKLKEIFSDDLLEKKFKYIGFLCSHKDLNNWDTKENYKNQRYRFHKGDSQLVSGDGVIFFVSTQWTAESIKGVIKIANKLGYSIYEKNIITSNTYIYESVKNEAIQSKFSHESSLTNPQDTKPGKRRSHILRVSFPDGQVFEDNNVSNTYCEVIKRIGPEEVSILDIYHAGVNIVSRELDLKYANFQRDIGGGWYVMTNSPTRVKYSDLQRIKGEYGINMVIELVAISQSSTMQEPKLERESTSKNVSHPRSDRVLQSTKHNHENKLYLRSKTLKAKAIFSSDKFVVLKGSEASTLNHSTVNKKRKALLEARAHQEGNVWILDKDISFTSPSTASGFLYGRSSNGLLDWIDENGNQLKHLCNREQNSQKVKEADVIVEKEPTPQKVESSITTEASHPKEPLFLFRKKVDNSFKTRGFTLANNAYPHIPKIVGQNVERGSSKKVVIVINDFHFLARLNHIGFSSNQNECYQLYWIRESGIIEFINDFLATHDCSEIDIYGEIGMSAFILKPIVNSIADAKKISEIGITKKEKAKKYEESNSSSLMVAESSMGYVEQRGESKGESDLKVDDVIKYQSSINDSGKQSKTSQFIKTEIEGKQLRTVSYVLTDEPPQSSKKISENTVTKQNNPAIVDNPEVALFKNEFSTMRTADTMKVSDCHVSLDAPFFDGEDNCLLDVLPNEDSPMADSSLNQESLSKEVNRALEQLNPRERDILKMFFGIGCQEMTLEEIGAKFDLTRERVRQIKEKAIRRLKGQKSKLLKAYLG